MAQFELLSAKYRPFQQTAKSAGVRACIDVLISADIPFSRGSTPQHVPVSGILHVRYLPLHELRSRFLRTKTRTASGGTTRRGGGLTVAYGLDTNCCLQPPYNSRTFSRNALQFPKIKQRAVPDGGPWPVVSPVQVRDCPLS